MIYRIYQRTNEQGDFVQVKEVTDVKTAVIEDLTPNTKYEFAVTAFNGKKESERSNVVAVTTGEIPVESIAISVSDAIPEVGETVTTTVTIVPENATNKTITFTSSDTAVATIDEQGNIQALQVGKTTIKATSANGKVAELEIEVFEALVPVINLEATDITSTTATLTWE